MPELTRILTDDVGTITHIETIDGERLTMEELAQHLESGHDYFVTFDEEKRYVITMVAEDGRLEPTIDDPSGEHTIWDLPSDDDPEEEEIVDMFDEMDRMGEYDLEVNDPNQRKSEDNPEELL